MEPFVMFGASIHAKDFVHPCPELTFVRKPLIVETGNKRDSFLKTVTHEQFHEAFDWPFNAFIKEMRVLLMTSDTKLLEQYAHAFIRGPLGDIALPLSMSIVRDPGESVSYEPNECYYGAFANITTLPLTEVGSFMKEWYMNNQMSEFGRKWAINFTQGENDRPVIFDKQMVINEAKSMCPPWPHCKLIVLDQSTEEDSMRAWYHNYRAYVYGLSDYARFLQDKAAQHYRDAAVVSMRELLVMDRLMTMVQMTPNANAVHAMTKMAYDFMTDSTSPSQCKYDTTTLEATQLGTNPTLWVRALTMLYASQGKTELTDRFLAAQKSLDYEKLFF